MRSFIYFLLLINLIYCNEIKQKTFPGFQGTISALGDFNSDKFTDIFLIKNNQKCFQIILQERDKTENDKQIFKDADNGKLKNICVFEPFDDVNQIINIIPSDYDGDALMDVAIFSKDTVKNLYSLKIFKGLKTSINESAMFSLDGNLTSFPLLLDYNGDMISDILVSELDSDGKSNYYVYLGGKNFEKIPFDQSRKDIKIANQNSHAFIDLNGDGVSDIFLEEKNEMHYYFADKDGYDKSIKIKYPDYQVIGSSTFCDINSDEKIDHLIPVCKSEFDKKSCLIIYYDSVNNKWEKLIDEIKVGDDYFHFAPTQSINNKGLKIDIPIRLRHGYVNENGFTDLMALMKNTQNQWHIVLFNNKKIDHRSKKGELNISFEISALNETMNGPILATFFDLYEDGVVDILVNYKNEKPNDINKNDITNYEFKALTLNDFADVNFVKVLVTSGLCTNGNCYEKGTYGEDQYLTPFGTNSPGSMVCYQLINSNSDVMKSCGGQLSQSSNFALQMPYTIFGLGLYANYIEKLSVSIPSGNTTKILLKKVEQIVPDSQIVFIPNPINDPSSWKVKLFLTPSDIIFKTLYTLTGICVFLIIIIGVLHRKEMLEDVKERAEFKKQWPEFRR